MKRADFTVVLMGFALLLALWHAGSLWVENRTLERLYAEASAFPDTVMVLDSLSVAKLARAVADERSLRMKLEKDHAAALERLKARPVSAVQATIEADPETVKTVLIDTVDAAGASAWFFREREGRYAVEGNVYPAERRISLAVDQDPITVEAVISQTTVGNWIGTVHLDDPALHVRRMNVTVVPRKPGWIERHRRWFYAGAFAAGVYVGMKAGGR